MKNKIHDLVHLIAQIKRQSDEDWQKILDLIDKIVMGEEDGSEKIDD